MNIFDMKNFGAPNRCFDKSVSVDPISATSVMEVSDLESWCSQELSATPIRNVQGEPVMDVISLVDFTHNEIGDCATGKIYEEKLPQSANLQTQMTAFLTNPQQVYMPSKAISEFEKEPIGLAITEIIDMISTEGSFAVIDGTLCRFKQRIWKQLMTTESEQAEIKSWAIEHLVSPVPLRPRHVKEIACGVKTNPKLYFDSKDFLSQELKLTCADGIYDVMSGTVYPSSMSYGFFHFLDISAYSLGTG